MNNFFARLTGDERQTHFMGAKPALYEDVQPLPSPPQTSAIGATVRAFDKAYQAQLIKRTALEAQIAGLQEDLRQTTVIIASIEAAMTVASADPALTADEKDAAAAAVSNRINVEAGDIGDV